MLRRDIFANISPIDHRYSLSEDEFNLCSRFLSEKAKIKYQARVEAALVRVLAKQGFCPPEVADEVENAAKELTIAEIYHEEGKTKHNIRALVNCLQRHVSEEAKPYIHFTVTSYDIIDTANSLCYNETSQKIIIPALVELERTLMQIALREKNTLQIGRTHGQHALPITFGFAMAEYVSRLGNSIQAVMESSRRLKGKISGAVGAYNALNLFIDDPELFEKDVLKELGLEPAAHSTQIVEPEYLTDFIHALISCFGVIANLSDDMRQLQRTEIGEVGEYFEQDQVGSSTMPHKRNPINYENVKSLWKEFMPRMITVYLDQISEHQRDLTNSASSRFIPEIIVGLLTAVNRLTKVLAKMTVDKNNLLKNFKQQKDLLMAEPLYILLAAYGHPAAHEEVRRLTLAAERSGESLNELFFTQKELLPYYEKFTKKQQEILNKPAEYLGIAAAKTERVVAYWQEQLGLKLL